MYVTFTNKYLIIITYFLVYILCDMYFIYKPCIVYKKQKIYFVKIVIILYMNDIRKPKWKRRNIIKYSNCLIFLQDKMNSYHQWSKINRSATFHESRHNSTKRDTNPASSIMEVFYLFSISCKLSLQTSAYLPLNEITIHNPTCTKKRHCNVSERDNHISRCTPQRQGNIFSTN